MFVSGANLNVLIARTVLFVELLFPDTFQLISQTAVTSSKWMVAMAKSQSLVLISRCQAGISQDSDER